VQVRPQASMSGRRQKVKFSFRRYLPIGQRCCAKNRADLKSSWTADQETAPSTTMRRPLSRRTRIAGRPAFVAAGRRPPTRPHCRNIMSDHIRTPSNCRNIGIEPGLSRCASAVANGWASRGTHWYHAHKHGSTGHHLFNGMSGAFIMPRRRLRRQTAVVSTKARLNEKLLFIQQITSGSESYACAHGPIRFLSMGCSDKSLQIPC